MAKRFSKIVCISSLDENYVHYAIQFLSISIVLSAQIFQTERNLDREVCEPGEN